MPIIALPPVGKDIQPYLSAQKPIQGVSVDQGSVSVVLWFGNQDGLTFRETLMHYIDLMIDNGLIHPHFKGINGHRVSGLKGCVALYVAGAEGYTPESLRAALSRTSQKAFDDINKLAVQE